MKKIIATIIIFISCNLYSDIISDTAIQFTWLKFLANTMHCSSGVPVLWLGDSNSFLMNYTYWLETNVCNPSVPGYTTYDILGIEDNYLVHNPGKAFIMIGGNNTLEDLTTFTESYRSIMLKIKTKGIPIYCVCILNQRSTHPDWNAWIAQANIRIQSLCATYGATYINVPITDSDLMDSVHLNYTGKMKLVNAVKPYI